MNTATLLWGVLFGGIGIGYFMWGKKQKKNVARFCGIGLMVYTYFIEDPLVIVGIGLALMAVPFVIRE